MTPAPGALQLEIASGECVAVVGRNGSGKTTAVRVIAGLLEPSGGVVEIDGCNMHAEPEAARARGAATVVLDTPAALRRPDGGRAPRAGRRRPRRRR